MPLEKITRTLGKVLLIGGASVAIPTTLSGYLLASASLQHHDMTPEKVEQELRGEEFVLHGIRTRIYDNMNPNSFDRALLAISQPGREVAYFLHGKN